MIAEFVFVQTIPLTFPIPIVICFICANDKLTKILLYVPSISF